jgi:NAD-dependent dihydropyrimidine dehydrogenase PreA subunit
VLDDAHRHRCRLGFDPYEAHPYEGLRSAMTYVITEPCIGVKDASCVDVCPVDCIHATDDDPQYYIDPDECIDCGACEPECPVTAIFAEDAVPDDQQQYIQINADYFKQ